MHSVLAMSVVYLLFPGSTAAAEAPCDHNWTTQTMRLSRTGIVLETGIEGFKPNQPAPADLLKKIGPLLCAAGSEELRVANVNDRSYFGDPARHAERGIRLDEFIRGRTVRGSSVNISVNIETNEVMMINANFLPDHEVEREPRLTAAQARAKVEARIRKDSYVELKSAERVKISFYDIPAHLAYEIEQFGFAPARGVLVWILNARGVDHDQQYEVSVSAATGEVIALNGLLFF